MVRTRPAKRVVEPPVSFQIDISDDESSNSENEDGEVVDFSGILEVVA